MRRQTAEVRCSQFGEMVHHSLHNPGSQWVGSTESQIAKDYLFEQYCPNPFNPSTTIEFALPKSGHASLKVFNLIALVVARLVDEELSPGTYTAEWNASGVASGVYFYRLKAGDFVETKKLLLLR